MACLLCFLCFLLFKIRSGVRRWVALGAQHHLWLRASGCQLAASFVLPKNRGSTLEARGRCIPLQTSNAVQQTPAIILQRVQKVTTLFWPLKNEALQGRNVTAQGNALGAMGSIMHEALKG